MDMGIVKDAVLLLVVGAFVVITCTMAGSFIPVAAVCVVISIGVCAAATAFMLRLSGD